MNKKAKEHMTKSFVESGSDKNLAFLFTNV